MLKVIGNFNLGDDAVQKSVNGKNVVNWNGCHSENFTDANGVKQQKSVWVNFSWWTDRCAILPYLKKGVSILVDGTPSSVLYKNKEGVYSAQFHVRVNTVQLLSKPQQRDSTPETTPQDALEQEPPF
jgi:single-strand DNA-binding protein